VCMCMLRVHVHARLPQRPLHVERVDRVVPGQG